MNVELTIDDTEVYDTLPTFEWEKYQKGFLGILNNAYNQSCNTGTKVLGDMSEITSQYDGGSYTDFLVYYADEWDGTERTNEATQRMADNIVNRIESVGGRIDEKVAFKWANQYVQYMLVNSYRGFMDEARAIELVADEVDADWRVADSSKESEGVDGYIDERSVQVKPDSHNDLDINDYDADVLITYYYTDDTFVIEAEPSP